MQVPPVAARRLLAVAARRLLAVAAVALLPVVPAVALPAAVPAAVPARRRLLVVVAASCQPEVRSPAALGNASSGVLRLFIVDVQLTAPLVAHMMPKERVDACLSEVADPIVPP